MTSQAQAMQEERREEETKASRNEDLIFTMRTHPTLLSCPFRRTKAGLTRNAESRQAGILFSASVIYDAQTLSVPTRALSVEAPDALSFCLAPAHGEWSARGP